MTVIDSRAKMGAGVPGLWNRGGYSSLEDQRTPELGSSTRLAKGEGKKSAGRGSRVYKGPDGYGRRRQPYTVLSYICYLQFSS